MNTRLGQGLTPTRLRIFLALLFIALAVPSALLMRHTQAQLRWEAFHQYRALADELGRRIDADLGKMIDAEEARGYADYAFVVIAGDPNTSKLLQRSALARYPVQSAVPGVIGYFQVDAEGVFSTPLLPGDLSDPMRWGLNPAEIEQRLALRSELIDVLVQHQLLDPRLVDSPWPSALADRPSSDAANADNADAAATARVSAQAVFDDLNAPTQPVSRTMRNVLGHVDDLRLQQNYQSRSEQTAHQAMAAPIAPPLNTDMQIRAKRTEQAAIVESPQQMQRADNTLDPPRVQIFQSEVDPFEFGLLDATRAVLYRKVWRNGQRTIQGAILDWNAFVDDAMVQAFDRSGLVQMSDMAVAYQHDVVRFARSHAAPGISAGTRDMRGELLHQARLSAPFGEVLLLWNVDRMPIGDGGRWMLGVSVVLLTVLILGFVLLDRLGLRQILLTRQQQDFVSAVSHELNTPLTSIRMYAEMLEAGWVGEDKKRDYYRFIHDESQRLSRLIANVLRLARMEREDLQLDQKPIAARALSDWLHGNLGQQIERAGFTHQQAFGAGCEGRELVVDTDAVLQIVINLVDNALKFAARAACRTIEIGMRLHGNDLIMIYIRDHGPGVERAQMRKIFGLFYRPGNELTRETPGTGIGLALVRQLARAMDGDVEVINRHPGAEFQLLLPARDLQPEVGAAQNSLPATEE